MSVEMKSALAFPQVIKNAVFSLPRSSGNGCGFVFV